VFPLICILEPRYSYWGVSLTLVIKNLRDILVNHPEASIADRFDIANQASLKLYLAEVYLPMVNVRCQIIDSYPISRRACSFPS
jgi:hypothetical protein